MKRIDFENGTITNNILNAAIPMLVAQILSLLYNIVDRVYIARIPDVGTNALGAVGLCFPIIMIMTAFSNLFGSVLIYLCNVWNDCSIYESVEGRKGIVKMFFSK